MTAVENPGRELPIMGADRGEEVFRTTSLDVHSEADRGSRPVENKYKDMSFWPSRHASQHVARQR